MAAVVNRRKSLLPAGITAFYGDFESGDVVDLLAPNGSVVARGFVGHDAAEMPEVIGRSLAELPTELPAPGGARGRSDRGAERRRTSNGAHQCERKRHTMTVIDQPQAPVCALSAGASATRDEVLESAGPRRRSRPRSSRCSPAP